MKLAVMSCIRPDLTEEMEKLGYKTVGVKPYSCADTENAESSHADMQALALPEGDIFLIRSNDSLNEKITNAVSDKSRIKYTADVIRDFSYPECVRLNAAVVGRSVIANLKYIDTNLAERLKTLGYRLIHVDQGYAKCSVCVVGENALITSDRSITVAARANGIDTLEISPGGIGLCERYGGFIGGASVLLDETTLAFFGDITAHADYPQIAAFCRSHYVDIVSLFERPLFDIGGIVIIDC